MAAEAAGRRRGRRTTSTPSGPSRPPSTPRSPTGSDGATSSASDAHRPPRVRPRARALPADRRRLRRHVRGDGRQRRPRREGRALRRAERGPARASRRLRRVAAAPASSASVYDDEPWIERAGRVRAGGARRPRGPSSGSASVTSSSAMRSGAARSGRRSGWGVGALPMTVAHRSPGWTRRSSTATLLYSHQDQVTALPRRRAGARVGRPLPRRHARDRRRHRSASRPTRSSAPPTCRPCSRSASTASARPATAAALATLAPADRRPGGGPLDPGLPATRAAHRGADVGRWAVAAWSPRLFLDRCGHRREVRGERSEAPDDLRRPAPGRHHDAPKGVLRMHAGPASQERSPPG